MTPHLRGCTGKRKYATRELAMAIHERVAAKRLTRPMYPYQCDFCGCWHVSSMSPRAFEERNRQIAEYRARFRRGAKAP